LKLKKEAFASFFYALSLVTTAVLSDEPLGAHQSEQDEKYPT
jgi:hypothetical protein